MAGKLIHFDKKSNRWEDNAEAAMEDEIFGNFLLQPALAIPSKRLVRAGIASRK